MTNLALPLRPRMDSLPSSARGQASQHPLRIQPVRTSQDRLKADRLVYESYRGKGLISNTLSFDAFTELHCSQPGSFTFLAGHQQDIPAGTVTNLYDIGHGLPADEAFPEYLSALRASGRRLAEVSRFVVRSSDQNSKATRLRLINFLFIHAAHVRKYTDLVIEVHPRHTLFYRRLLLFETLGPQRPCARVGSAPAVLLRLKLETYLEAMKMRGLHYRLPILLRRSLYASFMPSEMEQEVLRLLADPNH